MDTMDIEDDILDYEIPSSPEVDDSNEALHSRRFGAEVYGRNSINRKETNDCDLFVPSSGTAVYLPRPIHSPKVTIKLDSVFTEIETDLSSALRADDTGYASASPPATLNMQYPKVSFDSLRSFFNKKEGSDSDASKAGSPQCSSPVLSMRIPKVSYTASSFLPRNLAPINHSETGQSPKVSFNASSFLCSAESQTRIFAEFSGAPNPDTSALKVGLDPSSTLGIRSVSSKHDEQYDADITSENLDSRASEARAEVCLQSEKNVPEREFSHCFPRVSFNPSSLIFSDDPQTASTSLESPNPVTAGQTATNIYFDPSALLEGLSMSGSDDERRQSPINDTLKNLDPNQESVSTHPPFNGLENSAPMESSGLRGILKQKKGLSPNEKIVTDCLKLLCKTANDDRDQVRDMIHSSAKKVFKNLCFDQFFRKGECISSCCDDNHQYKSHIFTHGNEELWNASLYVICHAAVPNLQVVENLVQHYTAKGNTIRSLLLAKCIAKVRDADRLELAHFIVNQLSTALPPRDVITVILMLNLSALSSLRYNTLMEGLGVFEQNTTHYSELMAFLNFHVHTMPARFLVKLMQDSIKHSGRGSFVESIWGFLKRLHPNQKNEIQPTVTAFEEKFGILPTTDEDEDEDHHEQPPEKKSKIAKKKVVFAADPEIREFEVADCHEKMQIEIEDPIFSDEDCENDDELPITSYGSTEPREDTVKRIFEGLCCSLLLHGRCLDTVCGLIHDFGKDFFAGLSSEDARVAADFIIDQSKTPSFEILKIFINVLVESLERRVELSEIARILKLRKFSSKLSTSDSLKLTRMVLSVISKLTGLWNAIEKVLVPIPVELEDPEDGRFLFDRELIHFIIAEANKNKSSLLKCVSRAIMEQIALLPQGYSGEFVEVATLFVKKFVMTGREVESLPDILPERMVQPNRFASELKVALYQGVPSKYFVATIMMKQAVNCSWKDQAVDVLYTFLLSHFDRARVLTHLFYNCKYFDHSTKSSVGEIIGTAALKTAIRLYESEKFAKTAELFTILEQNKLKLNIFVLLATLEEKITELDLATMYCSVKVDTVHREHVAKVFFTRCVDPVISTGSPCPPAVMKLTAKMFRQFTSSLMVEETLELYKGITSRQKSLVRPFNIVEFVEPTLRCTFNRLCDDKIRRESVLLYIDVVDSETRVVFHKVTHRSMFLIAVMLITHASQEFEVKGHINIIHPLIKKMLVTCIKEGVYFDLRTPDITIYSSMTAKEIEVYVLWWFFLHVRARKKKGCDYVYPITVRIIQDCIQDNSHLPLHPSLRHVNVSITDCVERVTSVIKHSIAEPIAIIAGRERGVFQLHPATVRALSQTACNIMLQNGYITAEVNRMCTYCFDKLNVQISEQLP